MLGKPINDFKLFSQEAYFGDNNPFVNECLKHIVDLRQLVTNKEGNSVILKKLTMLGKVISKHTNIEEVNVGLLKGFNSNTYPLANIHLTSNLKQSNLDAYLNKRLAVKQDKDGYKYVNGKGLKTVIFLGIDMLTKKTISDRTICAVLFHEIGHSFDMINTSVRQRAHNLWLTEIRKKWYRMLAILHVIFSIFVEVGFIFKFVYLGVIMAILRKPTNNPPDSQSIERYKGLFDEYQKRYLDKNINNFVGKNNTDTNTKAALKKTFSDTFIYKIIRFICSILFYDFILAAKIIFLPYAISTLIIENTTSVSNKTNKFRRENFADYFATAYGLGKDMGKYFRATPVALHSNIAKTIIVCIPIIALQIKTIELIHNNNARSIEGYESDAKRVINIIKTLKRELSVNTDLTKAEKQSIKYQIESLEEEYEAITKNPEIYSLAMAMVNRKFNGDYEKQNTWWEKTIERDLNRLEMKDGKYTPLQQRKAQDIINKKS